MLPSITLLEALCGGGADPIEAPRIMAPPMRLVVDRYRVEAQKLRWLVVGLTVSGGLASIWGVFFVVVGILMVFMGKPDQAAAGPAASALLGGIPLLVGGTLLGFGIHFARRLGRLRRLAMAIRRLGSPTREQIEVELGLGGAPFERLLLEALERGVIDEGEAPSRAEAPPGPAPGWPATAPRGAPTPAPPPPGGEEASSGRPSLSGAVIGGSYAVERPLAAGAMGRVYVARQIRTGKRYAVKTLLPDARTSSDAIRRFGREAAAASALGHPGIVAVHDFDVTAEGVHYLVMDYLEGETLEARLSRQGALAWPEARRIALEIASAVSAAHDAGILHRDLTPANVFLATTEGAPERAVLLDLGLAKPLDEASAAPLTRTGVALGTPLYMSPEQARGEDLDVRADVYGLGAVLYEMATGTPPFVDRTLAEVYARLMAEGPAAASAVARRPLPAGLDDVLGRALARRREDRFPTARALAQAIELIPEA